MGVRVRPAAGRDFERVTALLEELGRPRVEAGPRDVARAVYERDLADPGSEHLVAEDGSGALLGFCSLQYRPRLNHTSEQAWIPDLIVAPDARRRGLARALLAEAETRARRRGCHDLTLESSYFRTEAHRLYEEVGMEDGGKFFRKPLG